MLVSTKTTYISSAIISSSFELNGWTQNSDGLTTSVTNTSRLASSYRVKVGTFSPRSPQPPGAATMRATVLPSTSVGGELVWRGPSWVTTSVVFANAGTCGVWTVSFVRHAVSLSVALVASVGSSLAGLALGDTFDSLVLSDTVGAFVSSVSHDKSCSSREMSPVTPADETLHVRFVTSPPGVSVSSNPMSDASSPDVSAAK